MCELARIWGFVDERAMNPARGITRFKEQKRERYITPQELPKLAVAIDNESNLYDLLVHVAANDGVGQLQVERELCMEKSTLSRNVERMVRQGWLDVWSGEDDRSQGLGVTAKGKRLIERAYPMWAKAQRKAKTVLGGPGAVAVGRMVRRLGAPAGGK